MNGADLRLALRRGNRVYGTLIASPSPMWVAAVKGIGLDFVFIDTEHVAIDRETLSWMCVAYREANLAPVVRIPAPDPYAASMVLDGGAAGVIAPYIETADEVRELVGAIKYKPLKGRRMRDAVAEPGVLGSTLAEYLERQHRETVFIANIESRPALEALDDILAIEHLDGVLVGPHDLTCSLGIPEQYTHADYLDAVERIIKQARQHGKGAGIHMFYPDEQQQELQFARAGANLIVHRGDIIAVRETLRNDFAALKKALGDRLDDDAAGTVNI